ncbi:uncharacterized protein Dwil_GK18848 [Drosophila willistoni]|uniref:Uncharacterized protein n=1 Tax=Drosophila willistoni TaxID=7260 RepID=B4NE34_DROWI|nr:endochitinase A [Drosophila willistoni]EDW82003.2 uncharacterized protein Dwil_GK18848 [Drosophila willistoni]
MGNVWLSLMATCILFGCAIELIQAAALRPLETSDGIPANPVAYKRWVRRRPSPHDPTLSVYEVRHVYFVRRSTTPKPKPVIELNDEDMDLQIRCDFQPTLPECNVIHHGSSSSSTTSTTSTTTTTTTRTTIPSTSTTTTPSTTTTTTDLPFLPTLPSTLEPNEETESVTDELVPIDPDEYSDEATEEYNDDGSGEHEDDATSRFIGPNDVSFKNNENELNV